MPQLGATLEDLLGLRSRLETSSSEIAANNDSTQATTSQTVSTFNDQSSATRSQIEGFMAALRADVGDVANQALGTDWTGQNREGFVANYDTFQAEMTNAANATDEYFTQLAATVTEIMAQLEEYQTTLSAALIAAQDASQSMSVAVQGQHDNLDAAMNTGMTFG